MREERTATTRELYPNRSLLMIVGVLLLVIPAAKMFAQNSNQRTFQYRPSRRLSPSTAVSPGSPTRLIATASPDVIWVECPSEAQAFGALCGKLPVPLDREYPNAAKINIYFEVYVHSSSAPVESAILLNPGGPGASTTYYRALILALFAQDLDVHDLLLMDDRGRGLSSAIDCPDLQHATTTFQVAETKCAAQLGADASRYGTGDVALDTDAVRAALGYDKVDYWGGSYGGEDVTAYATRFGEHLRSIVLDAPEGTPALRPFLLDGDQARSTARAVRLDCLRSPSCSVDHANPDDDFVQLIERIRNKAVRGAAHDASGNLVNVTLDEPALLFLALYETGRFVSTGELLAAGSALSHGDSVPLLRLGAEVTPFVTDYGDPTTFSQGAYFATTCTDAFEPWRWELPVVERKQELGGAISILPSYFFVPFSKVAGTGLDASLERQCLWWQKPTASSPVTPPHPAYPIVPTLVMVGDMDTHVPIEEVKQVAALFPESALVRVAEAGHLTILWTQCSANLQSQFFKTLQVGDTSCTEAPETVWPAVGRFPLVAADARPAEVDATGRNEIGVAERKVATVAVATLTDALKRSTIGSGNGAGLRAGTFQSSTDADGNQATTLTNCEFVRDVIVNGTITWASDYTVSADLIVTGRGTAGGQLHVEGAFEAPGPVGFFKVFGIIGGHRVSLLVPEA